MKKIFKSLFLISLFAIGVSCEDKSLDPLQFDKVAKGTIIALRGPALTKLYAQGKPISEIFPRIATGNEKFSYEAEILAADPTTVASVDVFAIKGSGATTERKLLKNIPASAFVKGAYTYPSAAIELTIKEVFSAIGLSSTFPLNTATVNTLLSTYKFGVNIESDINMTDGSKVLAADIVSSGLFGSNQFYPAMKLTWVVTDYCTYIPGYWGGDYNATETSEFFGGYGPYTITLVAAGANKFTTDNWYDSGIPIYMNLTPSTSVPTQIVTVPLQEYTTGSGAVRLIEGSGIYNQCKGEMSINFTYKSKATGDVLDALIWKLVKK